MARFRLEVGFTTDVGRLRKRNEDSCAVWMPSTDDENPCGLTGLMLVADGMGGERAGDRASQMASERVRDWTVSGAWRGWPGLAGGASLTDGLGATVRRASDEIFAVGENNPAIRGLGSTVVVAALAEDRVIIAHVGDSRCYRIRAGTIELMTSDHSWVERQVRAGFLTPEQARTHPQRNVLTRSLGDETTPEVDLRSDPLRHGDVFVLCSDGLTGGVTDEQILARVGDRRDPQAMADDLVVLANELDGSDNITAVVGLCLAADGSWASESEDTRPFIPHHRPS